MQKSEKELDWYLFHEKRKPYQNWGIALKGTLIL